MYLTSIFFIPYPEIASKGIEAEKNPTLLVVKITF